MTVFLVLALIVWAVSAIGLIVFVLLHSGKGTGLSEMFGGVMPTSVDRHQHHREEPRPHHRSGSPSPSVSACSCSWSIYPKGL